MDDKRLKELLAAYQAPRPSEDVGEGLFRRISAERRSYSEAEAPVLTWRLALCAMAFSILFCLSAGVWAGHRAFNGFFGSAVSPMGDF